VTLLRLLQLADSGLPVGAASHSFGLESLIDDGVLDVEDLESFLQGYLEETGALDAAFCRAAHRLSSREFSTEWRILNQQLSARKVARESRDASLTLGRRLLNLAAGWMPEIALPDSADSHHVTAFGLVAGLAGIDELSTVQAWLHQSTTALISAALRLAPLGQTRASNILWNLKPHVARVSDRRSSELNCFTPLPELAAMRHSQLSTRLFIS
jgi:urease accessory protein